MSKNSPRPVSQPDDSSRRPASSGNEGSAGKGPASGTKATDPRERP